MNNEVSAINFHIYWKNVYLCKCVCVCQ